VLDTGLDRISGLAFSPDGKMLAVATPSGGRILAVDGGPAGVVLRDAGRLHDITWSADGKTIAAACDSPPSIGLWAPDGSVRKRLPLSETPLSCTFQPGGLILAAIRARQDDTPRFRYGAAVLDADSGQKKVEVLSEPVEQRFSADETDAGSAALASGAGLIATAGGADPAIRLWGQADGKPVRTLSGKGRAVWSAGWGYEGQSIAWGDEGKIDDVEANKPRPLRYLLELKGLKHDVIPTDQYQLALEADEDAPIEGSIATGELYKRNSPILAHLFEARCGVILPGSRAAIGSRARVDPRQPFASFSIAVFNTETGGKPQYFLEGHRGPVNALSVSESRDDKPWYLLSGSDDQTLTIWDVERKQRVLSLFQADQDWVSWKPDGSYAASASGARLVGWHVNQEDELAHFFPLSDMHQTRYHPDSVQVALAQPRGQAGPDRHQGHSGRAAAPRRDPRSADQRRRRPGQGPGLDLAGQQGDGEVLAAARRWPARPGGQCPAENGRPQCRGLLERAFAAGGAHSVRPGANRGQHQPVSRTQGHWRRHNDNRWQAKAPPCPGHQHRPGRRRDRPGAGGTRRPHSGPDDPGAERAAVRCARQDPGRQGGHWKGPAGRGRRDRVA
jgi:WD40 repeat protein